MFRLIFKILADAAGFNRTLKTDMPATAKEGGKRAGKAAGEEMGKVMGAQLKAGIMRYIGAGAILSFVTNAATKAADTMKESLKEGLDPEAYQELKKAVDMTGLSMDELQEKAAKAPKEFIKLMEVVRSQGGILPKSVVEDLDQAKTLMSELTTLATILAGKILKIAAVFGIRDAKKYGEAVRTIGQGTGSSLIEAAGASVADYAAGVEGRTSSKGIAAKRNAVTGFLNASAMADKEAAWRESTASNVSKWLGVAGVTDGQKIGADPIKVLRDEGEKDRALIRQLIQAQKDATKKF